MKQKPILTRKKVFYAGMQVSYQLNRIARFAIRPFSELDLWFTGKYFDVLHEEECASKDNR